jgi:hypothetical protein
MLRAVEELEQAMERALAASAPFPAVAAEVGRAVALARFQAREPDGGPVWKGQMSAGVPQPPEGPMFPAFAAVRGDAGLDPLMDALEALQHELVWAADCAEFSDAVLNAAQFLRAGGHVDLAARAVLALAGAGLGLVFEPPVRVRELAASLGLGVDDLLAGGEPSMGSVAAAEPSMSASYAWDVHHEELVRTAEDLAPRTLVSYRARFPAGRAAFEDALRAVHGEPRAVAGRRRYGPFFVDDAATGAFALEWYAREPGWTTPPVYKSARGRPLAEVFGQLRAAAAAGELPAPPDAAGLHAYGDGGFELRPPMPAARLAAALGVPDAFARTVDVHMSHWQLATPAGDVRLGIWRIEASLDGRPAGGPAPGISLPAALARTLGGEEPVRRLRIAPAR